MRDPRLQQLPTYAQKANGAQSGEIYQLDSFGRLHKLILCSFLQKEVVACKESGKMFLEIKMAATPSRDVDLLELR